MRSVMKSGDLFFVIRFAAIISARSGGEIAAIKVYIGEEALSGGSKV